VKKLISNRCRRYFYATLAALFGLVIGLGGPGWTEARFFPMKVNHYFEQYETPDGSKVCIRMDIEIIRRGRVLFKSWTLQTREAHPLRIPLHTVKVSRAPTLKYGERGVVSLCAPKPEYLNKNPKVKYIIYGYVYYDVWHGLWQVPWHICEEHYDRKD